MAWVGQRA